jgi:pimeloyl-ACP methyl ester carboxylesterase
MKATAKGIGMTGFADVPPFFLEEAIRTDGIARAQVGASIDPAVTRDEVEVAAALKVPLAVLHGAREQLVNGAYFGSLKLPTLWRGATQVIAEAGHAPQWERPDEFDTLLRALAPIAKKPEALPALDETHPHPRGVADDLARQPLGAGP